MNEQELCSTIYIQKLSSHQVLLDSSVLLENFHGNSNETSFLAPSTLFFSWMNIVWISHVISSLASHLSWVMLLKPAVCITLCVSTVINLVCFSMPGAISWRTTRFSATRICTDLCKPGRTINSTLTTRSVTFSAPRCGRAFPARGRADVFVCLPPPEPLERAGWFQNRYCRDKQLWVCEDEMLSGGGNWNWRDSWEISQALSDKWETRKRSHPGKSCTWMFSTWR